MLISKKIICFAILSFTLALTLNAQAQGSYKLAFSSPPEPPSVTADEGRAQPTPTQAKGADKLEKLKPAYFAARAIGFIYFTLDGLLSFYYLLWIILIITSWLSAFGILQIDRFHPVVNFLYSITYDLVDKISGGRRLIVGMIDLTPLLFLLGLHFVKEVFLPFLFNGLSVLFTGYTITHPMSGGMPF